jgi:hypothetical protein
MVGNETTDLQVDAINSRVDKLIHQQYQQDLVFTMMDCSTFSIIGSMKTSKF